MENRNPVPESLLHTAHTANGTWHDMQVSQRGIPKGVISSQLRKTQIWSWDELIFIAILILTEDSIETNCRWKKPSHSHTNVFYLKQGESSRKQNKEKNPILGALGTHRERVSGEILYYCRLAMNEREVKNKSNSLFFFSRNDIKQTANTVSSSNCVLHGFLSLLISPFRWSVEIGIT